MCMISTSTVIEITRIIIQWEYVHAIARKDFQLNQEDWDLEQAKQLSELNKTVDFGLNGVPTRQLPSKSLVSKEKNGCRTISTSWYSAPWLIELEQAKWTRRVQYHITILTWNQTLEFIWWSSWADSHVGNWCTGEVVEVLELLLNLVLANEFNWHTLLACWEDIHFIWTQ